MVQHARLPSEGQGVLRVRSEAAGGLVVFVSDLGEKEAVLASNSEKFFTTPHYDGYPTVLVNLAAIEVDSLEAGAASEPAPVLGDHGSTRGGLTAP